VSAATPEARARRREYTRAWDAAHPESKRESHLRFRSAHPGYSAAWSREHPEDRRRQHLHYEYGMTPEQYGAMFEACGGLCAICGKPETRTGRTGSILALAVDHDHDTGAVRGLLCATCNTAVGLLNDDPQLLAAATAYLMRKVE